jgi:hypothetical protein
MKCHRETPYLAILNEQKCHSFILFLIKVKNRREEQVMPGGAATSGKGEEVGKGCRG